MARKFLPKCTDERNKVEKFDCTVMEVANGDYGDVIGKLVVAVQNGKCNNWNQDLMEVRLAADIGFPLKEIANNGGTVTRSITLK